MHANYIKLTWLAQIELFPQALGEATEFEAPQLLAQNEAAEAAI